MGRPSRNLQQTVRGLADALARAHASGTSSSRANDAATALARALAALQRREGGA